VARPRRAPLSALACVALVAAGVGALAAAPVASADTTALFSGNGAGIVTAALQTGNAGVPWHLEVASQQTFKAGDATHHFDPSVVVLSADETLSQGTQVAHWTASSPLPPGTYYARVWEDDTAPVLARRAAVCQVLGCVPQWDGQPILIWSQLVQLTVPPPSIVLQSIQHIGRAVAGRRVNFILAARYSNPTVTSAPHVRCAFRHGIRAVTNVGAFAGGRATCSFKMPLTRRDLHASVKISLSDDFGNDVSRSLPILVAAVRKH
jgi:hypothetical protein